VEDDWRKRLERSGCKTFVAFADDSLPVGLIVGAPYGDEAGIYSMWVDSRCRRSGIGSALIDAVVGWAKRNGFSKLYLDVTDSNAAAVAFYESKGFEKTGVTGTLPHPREHILEHQRCLPLSLEATTRQSQSQMG